MISFLLSVPQILRFLLLIAYIGCIAALSLLPPKDLPKIELFRGADKLIHLVMYLIFSMLGSWALKAEEDRKRIALIVIVTVLWGIFMEFMQRAMHAGRSFSWLDEVANTTGVVTGIILYILFTSPITKRK